MRYEYSNITAIEIRLLTRFLTSLFIMYVFSSWLAIANDHQDVYSERRLIMSRKESDSRRTEAEHLNDSRQNS